MTRTKLLFREDAYSRSCHASVISISEEGIELDQTVFYYTSGGQPGDIGILTLDSGDTVDIQGTVKSKTTGRLFHTPALGATVPALGTTVVAKIDWQQRYQFMKMHSCLHLLSAVIDGSVTGGQIGEQESRLDFDLPETNLDKSRISAALNALIETNHKITPSWISDEGLEGNPTLVKTMSVKPPMGSGLVRLINIENVDLQACGGTHVKRTGEIGRVQVTKIKNKGRHNRRISVALTKSSDPD